MLDKWDMGNVMDFIYTCDGEILYVTNNAYNDKDIRYLRVWRKWHERNEDVWHVEQAENEKNRKCVGDLRDAKDAYGVKEKGYFGSWVTFDNQKMSDRLCKSDRRGTTDWQETCDCRNTTEILIA